MKKRQLDDAEVGLKQRVGKGMLLLIMAETNNDMRKAAGRTGYGTSTALIVDVDVTCYGDQQTY